MKTATILLLLLLVTPALALQVSPAYKEFTLEPGSTSAYTLRVINEQGGNLTVSVDASPWSAAPSSFFLPQGEKAVTITLTHPPAETLPAGPTVYPVRVTARAAGDGQFGSEVSLIHELTLFRQYEGAWLEAGFATRSAYPGGDVGLTMNIRNRGLLAAPANGRVAISTPVGTLLGSVQLGTVTVRPGDSQRLSSTWSSEGIPPGRYLANATLQYTDPLTTQVQRRYGSSFTVGEPAVTIGDLPVALENGGTRRVSIPVTVEWNEPLRGHAETRLLDGDWELFRSSTETRRLAPGRAGTFDAFVEVDAALEGNYTLVVAIVDQDGAVLAERSGKLLLYSEESAAGRSPEDRLSLFVLGSAAAAVLILLYLFFSWSRGKRSFT